jgi:hypothetical protein
MNLGDFLELTKSVPKDAEIKIINVGEYGFEHPTELLQIGYSTKDNSLEVRV